MPVIRADETPVKIKAEDQGIPGVNHQDKLVYGRIRNDQSTPPIEHILPDPEPPLAHLKESTSAVKMVNQYTPDDINLEKGVDKPDPVKAAPPSITSIEALIEDDTPVKDETPKKKGKALLQLGSLKGYDLAEAEWARLSKKHKDILGGCDPLIQKVDLGEGQGIYYRLRTSFEDEASAKAACSSLKDKQVNCLVIR